MSGSVEKPGRLAVAWLCLSLVLAIVPHLWRLPLWVAVFSLGCVGWRLGIIFRGWIQPAMVTRVVLTVLAVLGTFVHYDTVFGRGAGITLLILMLSLKLLEINRMRDAYLIAALTYFVIASEFLFSQTPLVALYMFAVVVVVTMTLVVLQDRHGVMEKSGVFKRSGSLLLQAVPLMCVLFVLFPRLGSPIWGMPSLSEAKTGLSDTMSPGSILSLRIDDSPAFRVTFRGPVPPPAKLYWRGPVLWHYDGTTWSRGHVRPRRPRLAAIGNVRTYRVTLEPHGRHWLYALDMPLGAPPGAVRTGDFELLSRRPVDEQRSYTMRSALRYVANPTLAPAVRRAALQLLDGYNPRTRRLANAFARRADRPAEVVRLALEYFHNEPFVYSLSPPPLGRNAMDEFLFETRNGYCAHYASAFTVLMRAAGVPARVVTGYLGGDYNSVGDFLVVRQSDAHAWSEVWLRGAGWVRVDPTATIPLSRIHVDDFRAAGSGGIEDGWDVVSMLFMTWNAIQNNWNQWLVDYDREAQANLMERFGGDAGDWSDQIAALAVACVLALLAGVGVTWIRHRRRPPDPAVRQWQRFERKLRRAGMQTGPADAATAVAGRARRRWPRQAPRIDRITRAYIALRYRRQARPGALARLKRELRALKLPRRADKRN